ncbi:MAG TPA: ATP-binding protein [Anaerolineales bacterium]
MPDIIFLFREPTYVDLPAGMLGWLGWFVWLGANIYLLQRWWQYHLPWSPQRTITLIILTILVPVTSLLVPGIRLTVPGALPPPLLPIEPTGPVIMLLASLPWFLAAGMLGPAPAGGLAAFSGLLLAFWSSHDLFLPLELALLALVLSASLQQRYRTRFFNLMRHPVAAALLLIPVYSVLFVFSSVLTTRGVLAARLDFTITHIYVNTLALGISFLIAGVIAQITAKAIPEQWATNTSLRPSPVESSLAARFIYRLVPILLLLAVVLMVADWIVAGRVARQRLEGRMSNVAQMAADSVPFVLEAGQGLISQLAADPDILSTFSDDSQDLAGQELRVVPYFNELLLVDSDGQLINGYPDPEGAVVLSAEEKGGVELAANRDVSTQFYIISPGKDSLSARLSFITPVTEDSNLPRSVLIGRSDLAANPLAQPILTSLRSMSDIEGTGMLLDENDTILFHPQPEMLMSRYTGRVDEELSFYEDTAADGTRQLAFYQPVIGRSWGVLLTVPARYIQQQALDIAGPILMIIAFLAFAAVILVPLGLHSVTASLNGLALEANRIAGGNLDRPLAVDGEDEIGQVSRAFEQMRVSLRTRLEELSRLFIVSQGVASSLEIESSLQPVLEAALGTKAASARVILTPSTVPELNGDNPAAKSFGLGAMSDLYRNLDEQILALMGEQDRLLITNLSRPRLLVLSPGFPRPQAIMAMALRREKHFYGAMWLAYDHAHKFTDEEVNFVATLAGQAAMAAANASLFQTAEVGRQRLEAILASTPDPVLVTDHHNHLLLANPAAWQVLGFEIEAGRGKPIEEVIPQKALVDLLRSVDHEDQSVELVLPNERVYLATASTVMAEGRSMGRVCVLSDVTQFKKLDALKSEFVSTVSHDLRSPLTLIRGYTTMLQMVGDLNEQQTGYVRKIVSGVESMSRLVNNLLDLSRIEAGVGLQLDTLSVQDILERVVGALQLQAAQKRIKLGVELQNNMRPLIEADQALLQQALHNLLDNAIKYTDAGEISIKIRTHQDQMIFEVHDTGIGIAPADQQRLFEKFYRASHRGAKGERGSGLGLAIVKSIAERHGGRVWLKSQLGKGSSFYLAIPLQQPKGERESL